LNHTRVIIKGRYDCGRSVGVENCSVVYDILWKEIALNHAI
jgi:hypothetical protein